MASAQIKPKILEIIQKYYFPLNLQLIPCIPGLILSILPGLDENLEELKNNVFKTIEEAENCVGKKYLYGAI